MYVSDRFDVHGSVHIGNITYVQFKVQLDVLFYVLLFFILSSTCFGCYLHPSSGAQLQGRPVCGAIGALAPGADFEGAPKRRSPTGHTLIGSTVAW
jgi:hypothetical protein